MLCDAVVGADGTRGFDALASRAIERRDPLAMKVVRNLSQLDDVSTKKRFAPYVEPLIALLKSEPCGSDVMVETLGTLANVPCAEVDVTDLVISHAVLEFIATTLGDDRWCEDDVALEAVVFVGAVACDRLAGELVSLGLCERVYDMLSAKKEDD